MHNTLERQWNRFSRIPFGKVLFSYLIGIYIPYTGSMASRIEELRPGFARVTLRDRRRVRNHLRSVHAIALANLGEFTGNLALVCGLPDDARFIVKKLTMEYLKKARGRLTATCQAPVLSSAKEQDIDLLVEIRNAANEIVARCALLSLVGPKR